MKGNNMNDTHIFTVTTMEKLEKNKLGWLETGDIRTVGFFQELSDAQIVVVCNMGDINETIYDYAVIEELPFGLYPYSANRWFYKFNYDKKEYEAIEKPACVEKYTVFSL